MHVLMSVCGIRQRGRKGVGTNISWFIILCP